MGLSDRSTLRGNTLKVIISLNSRGSARLAWHSAQGHDMPLIPVDADIVKNLS
jgi:hypothetical protein